METVNHTAHALVARLHNLHEIFRVQGEILLYGEAAVEPLAEFLLLIKLMSIVSLVFAPLFIG